MKKLRLLGLCLLVAVSAFTLTSCLNDDDDNDNGLPTAAEKAQMFNSVKGAYSGIIYSFKKNVQTGKNETADSAIVACSINSDSTMVLSNVPAKFLALAIDTTTTEHKAIREAVAEQGSVNVNCIINFYKFYKDWSTYTFWFVYPEAVTFNVTANGKSHNVEIAFWSNSTSSYGLMNTSTRNMTTQILMAGAKIDGVEPSLNIANVVPLLFYKYDSDEPIINEKEYLFNIVKGSYSGKIYSFKTNTQTGKNEIADSADVACSINTDSTMVLSSVPARFLALAIDTTTTEHKAIRDAVKEQGSVDVNCLISFYKYYKEWTVYPFWFVYPKTVTFNVTTNGQSHKVEIAFWSNSTSSYGVVNTKTRAMSTQILMSIAKIDGVESTLNATNAIPLIFVKE